MAIKADATLINAAFKEGQTGAMADVPNMKPLFDSAAKVQKTYMDTITGVMKTLEEKKEQKEAAKVQGLKPVKETIQKAYNALNDGEPLPEFVVNDFTKQIEALQDSFEKVNTEGKGDTRANEKERRRITAALARLKNQAIDVRSKYMIAFQDPSNYNDPLIKGGDIDAFNSIATAFSDPTAAAEMFKNGNMRGEFVNGEYTIFTKGYSTGVRELPGTPGYAGDDNVMKMDYEQTRIGAFQAKENGKRKGYLGKYKGEDAYVTDPGNNDPSLTRDENTNNRINYNYKLDDDGDLYSVSAASASTSPYTYNPVTEEYKYGKERGFTGSDMVKALPYKNPASDIAIGKFLKGSPEAGKADGANGAVNKYRNNPNARNTEIAEVLDIIKTDEDYHDMKSRRLEGTGTAPSFEQALGGMAAIPIEVLKNMFLDSRGNQVTDVATYFAELDQKGNKDGKINSADFPEDGNALKTFMNNIETVKEEILNNKEIGAPMIAEYFADMKITAYNDNYDANAPTVGTDWRKTKAMYDAKTSEMNYLTKLKAYNANSPAVDHFKGVTASNPLKIRDVQINDKGALTVMRESLMAGDGFPIGDFIKVAPDEEGGWTMTMYDEETGEEMENGTQSYSSTKDFVKNGLNSNSPGFQDLKEYGGEEEQDFEAGKVYPMGENRWGKFISLEEGFTEVDKDGNPI